MRTLLAKPARGAFLGERTHPLAHVLRGERGAAQLDQLLFDVGRELALSVEQRCDHALVAELRERRVARQLARQLERQRLQAARPAPRA